jgi:hypothetical protein
LFLLFLIDQPILFKIIDSTFSECGFTKTFPVFQTKKTTLKVKAQGREENNSRTFFYLTPIMNNKCLPNRVTSVKKRSFSIFCCLRQLLKGGNNYKD